MPEPFRCALLILAAGASTRMGRPKQLLPVDGRPLLRRVVEAGLAVPVSPVIVVLGAGAAEIAPCLAGRPVQIVVHPGWAEGMGSSLRAGMEAITASAPASDFVVVALGDQPDFAASHLARLIETQHTTGRSIVAAEYAGVRGPPVLFAAKHFPALRTLQGDAGARALLQAHAEEVATVSFPKAADLDTPADYTSYLERNPPADKP